MKRWLIVLLIFIACILSAVYIFIPGILSLKAIVNVRATSTGIHRMLLDSSNLSRWWPGKTRNKNFTLNKLGYKINNGNITAMPISIRGQKTDLNTSLFLISVTPDSTQLQWVGTMVTSDNPVRRLLLYLEAKRINRDMTAILRKMKDFYSKPVNIYGLEIKQVPIVDSLLIATSTISNGYPATTLIYGLVDKLTAYAQVNSAMQSGYPMLNTETEDNIHYNVKVALPIDKMLPSSGDIVQKQMPGGYNILVTEVEGGINTTMMALDQLKKYAEDYQLKAAAIPFCSMVTDRLKEVDSTKWITKVYYPALIYK